MLFCECEHDLYKITIDLWERWRKTFTVLPQQLSSSNITHTHTWALMGTVFKQFNTLNKLKKLTEACIGCQCAMLIIIKLWLPLTPPLINNSSFSLFLYRPLTRPALWYYLPNLLFVSSTHACIAYCTLGTFSQRAKIPYINHLFSQIDAMLVKWCICVPR